MVAPDAPSREGVHRSPLEGAQRNLGAAFAEAATPIQALKHMTRQVDVVTRARELFVKRFGRFPRTRSEWALFHVLCDYIAENF